MMIRKLLYCLCREKTHSAGAILVKYNKTDWEKYTKEKEAIQEGGRGSKVGKETNTIVNTV